MNFFDLHIHSVFSEGESSLEQLAQRAKDLGFAGICFAEYYKNDEQIKKSYAEIEKVKQRIGLEILLGFEARNLKELATLADKRKKFDVLLARGGDLRLNREACETPEVDILTHPNYERIDSGLNQVLMKLAVKNNVAIEINLREVLIASKKTRSRILENIRANVTLAKKYRAQIITCSGSLTHWELRDPLCLSSFATLFGMQLDEAKATVSGVPESILQQSKKRKSEKWIRPGVEIV